MSSYLCFYLVTKKALEDFENKYSQLKERSHYSEEFNKTYGEMKKIVLFDFSRSSNLYQTFQNEFGYSSLPKKMSKEDANIILNSLKDSLKKDKESLKRYMEKDLIFDEDSSYAKAIEYIKNKKKKANNEETKELENVLKIILEAQENENLELINEIIQELNDSIEENKFSIGIMNSIISIIECNDYINKDYLLCYDFD